MPFISVIIPVLNGQKTIARCLESIREQTYDPQNYEILVVDNGSEDNTVSVVKQFPEVILLHEERRNSYLARNLGARYAHGQILAFTDADCRAADRKWLSSIARAFNDSSVGGICGEIKADDPETLVERFQAHQDIFSQRTFQHSRTGSYPLTANAAYRREVFDKLGGFDEELFSGGDLEFALRVEKSGYAIKTCWDCIVLHKHRANLRDLWRQYTRYGQGHRLLLNKGVINSTQTPPFSLLLYLPIGMSSLLLKEIKATVKFFWGKGTKMDMIAPVLNYYSSIAFRWGLRRNPFGE